MTTRINNAHVRVIEASDVYLARLIYTMMDLTHTHTSMDVHRITFNIYTCKYKYIICVADKGNI